MTSIERTAYPQFPRLMTARELHVFYTPAPDEAVWAQERTDADEHLLAMTVLLKSFQRMGRFPKLTEVPEAVIDHVRRCLELNEAIVPQYLSPRTAESHRRLIRQRVGVACKPGKARKLAEKAIRKAALVKNHPPDLINVALERLIQASLELPGFTTLNEIAARIRAEVNASLVTTIWQRLGSAERRRIEGLLEIAPDGKSWMNRLKQPAQRSSWSRFRKQAQHMAWVDALGESSGWVAGIAASKVADFAGEVAQADADVLKRYDRVKRVVLLACLVNTAQARARDDLAQMLCKRMSGTVKKAKAQLEDIRERQRALSEKLIGNYKAVLTQLAPDAALHAAELAAVGTARQVAVAVTGRDPWPTDTPAGELADGDARGDEDGHGDAAGEDGMDADAAVTALLASLREQSAGLAQVRGVVEKAGGFAAQLSAIEEVAAFHGDNYEVLVHRFFRPDRATMLALTKILTLEPTSADRRVLDALEHAVAYWGKRGEHITANAGDGVLDVSFASANWLKAIRDRDHPGTFVKKHFEAMVFTYLAEELRTGDVAVAGAAEFGDWNINLLPWSECEPLLAEFCEEAGLPATAAEFTAALKQRHAEAAAALDAGYSDNADLVIDEAGVPALKPVRGLGTSPEAERLGEEIKRRMPERTLISVLARTAHWLNWTRHFGPASGSDPKIKDARGRYILTTFVCGSNMTYAEAARHIPGVSAHEFSMVANRHATVAKLNRAIADVVNKFAELDVVKAWGDGSAVATDGTMVDTYLDNLLAETSIRYGGLGGIAYHYVSDLYIALFSRFIPCGAWEAIYIIDGLLANVSDVKPSTIHADTQGQSFPVFTLAHLFGFDLMPRIRNWKDLIFFRHSADVRYSHIEALFGETGRNVIDWALIEKHFQDLMRVAISIKEGRLNSVTMLRRLTSNSRRNEIYKAFREVGRSVRTVQLLRFLADAGLRRRVSAATNKAESYNGYTDWLRFGNAGVLASNDPAEQEKMIKFTSLLANCTIFQTAVDMSQVIRDLIAEGWDITAAQIAQLSPYITEHIHRFGIFATDSIKIRPPAFDPELAGIDFSALELAA